MFKLTVAVSCLVAVLAYPQPALDSNLDDDWKLFKQTHQKVYESSEQETLRRMIWEDHVNYIAKHNREYDMGLHSYFLGINEYTDMSNEEFVSVMNGYKHVNRTSNDNMYMPPSHVTLPSSVDWRREGYVTGVKNQGGCGSCWAFSTTGSLEGQHYRSTRRLVSLSEQNLVDCSTSLGNHGCHGGSMDLAFEYIKRNRGIDTEASYPYTGRDGTCHYRSSNIGATDNGYMNIRSGDENALQSAVATVGPISVAIDASHRSFQLYRGGIYNEPACSSRRLDHGVLAVGYGSSSGQAYWLVKNSWGGSWGQGGYVWMSRNKNNQCGIASSASYPTV